MTFKLVNGYFEVDQWLWPMGPRYGEKIYLPSHVVGMAKISYEGGRE